MKFRCFSIIFLVAVFFQSCNSQNPKASNINASEFEKGISREGVQVVDVRTPEEYSERHIQRSENININNSAFEKRMGGLDKSKPVYLYCLSGSRSARAADWAVKNGFKEVYNLDGGITAWIGAKLPVVTESGEIPSVGMSFDDYLNHIKASKKLVLVDFNAVWCGPCKILKPIVQRQVKKNADKVEFFEIDVDKNPAVATTMNVRAIPLILLYKNGKEVWRNMGVAEEGAIADKIKEFAN